MSEFAQLHLIILGNGYSWSKIKENFLSSWYSENNLRKAATLIYALEGKPKVQFFVII